MSQTPKLIQSPKYAKAKLRVDRCQDALKRATKSLKSAMGLASIKCCKCANEHPISEQTYIQTHWYTRPYGCTGGDYWNIGEANWRCPSCGFRNRFNDRQDGHTFPSEFYRPEIVNAKHMFKQVVDCYCDRLYLEQNRDRCSGCLKAGL